jgi:hypothetical protein
LLDESAPEENKSAEEISEQLQSSIRILQTRVARLTAEHISNEARLQERIDFLERKLKSYDSNVILYVDEDADEGDDDMELDRLLAE